LIGITVLHRHFVSVEREGELVVNIYFENGGHLTQLGYARIFPNYHKMLEEVQRDASVSPAEKATNEALSVSACRTISLRARAVGTTNDSADEPRKTALAQYHALYDPRRCEGIDAARYADEALFGAWERAAKMGDRRAISVVLASRYLEAPRIAHAGFGTVAPRPTPSRGPSQRESEQMLAGLSYLDPIFIGMFGPLLHERYADIAFKFEPPSPSLQSEETRNLLWQLVSCRFGEKCDGSHPLLLERCFEFGECQIGNLSKYAETRLTASDYLALQGSVSRIETAIRTGQWKGVLSRVRLEKI
jgi:hypothetical protein